MAFRLNQNQRIAAIRHYYQCGSNATEASRTIPDIRRVIADKIATIDMELCQKVCHSVAARLVSCIEHSGEQFEQSE